MKRFGLALIFTLLLGVGSAMAASDFVMVDILDWVNNDAISTAEFPGDQNFDGVGFGFPAEELPDGDFTLNWDDETTIPFMAFYKEDGWGNNIEAWGDTIDLPAGKYSALWILAAQHHGGIENEPLTLHYSDGSEGVGYVTAGDWCGGPISDEKMLVRPAYRHSQNGVVGPSCGMWLLPAIEIDAERELVAITLPDDDRFHVFGLTLQR